MFRRPTALVFRALTALVVTAAVAAGPPTMVAAAPASQPKAPLGAMSDAQLAARATQLEAETSGIGEALLIADEQQTSIVEDRRIAREALAQWLAEAYKHGRGGDDVLAELLVSNSFAEAAHRVRVASVIAEHHRNLRRSLATAQAKLDVRQIQRAQMITRLGTAQQQLVAITAETQRRVSDRDAFASAQARRAAAADEAAARAARRARQAVAAPLATAPASPVPSALVAASPARGFVPMAVPAAGPTSPQAIDAYLASKGSPMAGQGGAFWASGQRWQVDPRLLVAIAGAESNFGQQLCGPHNAWGWACPNDPADFGTWAAGIDTVTRGLRRYYLDEGRTSVTLIQQKYCPVGAANDPTGLNSHWSTNVTRFLLEQGGNPATVGPGPTQGLDLPDIGGLGLTGGGD